MARISAVFGFWALILIAGTTFKSSSHSSSHDVNFPKTENGVTASIPMKELKEGSQRQGISREEIQTDNKDSRDYSQIDSALKSTVNTVSSPIEHGTPIVPYIPGPTPPYPPKHDRFDSPSPA